MSEGKEKIFELYKRLDQLPPQIIKYESKKIYEIFKRINNCLAINSNPPRRLTKEDIVINENHFEHCVWSNPDCIEGPDTCSCVLFDLMIIPEFEKLINKMETFKKNTM